MITDRRTTEIDGVKYLASLQVADDLVSGWVLDYANPHQPQRVAIYYGGREIARLLAADFVDWRSIGLDGEAGFTATVKEALVKRPRMPIAYSCRIPNSIERGVERELTIRLGNEDVPLNSVSSDLAEETTGKLKRHFADYVHHSFQNLTFANGKLSVDGWLSAPVGATADFAIRLNDVPLEHYRIEAASAAECAAMVTVHQKVAHPEKINFSFWQERPYFKYAASVDLASVTPSERGYELIIESPPGQAYFTPGRVFFPADLEKMLAEDPVPEGYLIARTVDYRGDYSFLFAGLSNLCQIEDVIERNTSKRLQDFPRMLDFGCGTGRVIKHAAKIAGVEAHGIDIDAENIAWASSNIPDVDFRVCEFRPPTHFEDESLDLVFAFSVFTHLGEDDQFKWLEEIRRILRPGGLAALTVAGMDSLKRGRLNQVCYAYRLMRDEWICDLVAGNRLHGVIENSTDAYRNVKHSKNYIARYWSEYLEVVEHARGEQQDIVLLKKRQ